jgi:class 3 adenylate cyclase
MSTYLDILFQFQTELAEDILQILNERSERVLTDVASSSLVICVVIIILPITLKAIYNLTNDIQTYTISLAHKTKELNNEKRRTDSLLHQMLPKTVAERLKRKRNSLAEYFKEVTIFFSDMPGFSRRASELAPTEIVQVLNHIYTIFDSCIEKYDVYKVATIGDSYMVASGAFY